MLLPVAPGARIRLDDRDARAPRDLPEEDALDKHLRKLVERLDDLQSALFAENRRALLVVLQGRDTSGKDGLTRKVFGPLEPQGCGVTAFKRPSDLELSHDYLWRVHQAVPARGTIGIFNRSHYEDVLAVRVRNLAPEDVWSKRFGHINDFERMLTDCGTTVLKFFLHISREEQKDRLLKRLENPRKNWKFNPGDLDDRNLWDDYTEAYQDVLARTSTEWAPWYVVPADKKSVRDALVAEVVVDALEKMNPRFPKAGPEVLELATKIK